jgi:hypothetical protein
MKTVTVYDIDKQEWYMQETSGSPPGALTQGCTVVASAPDGSSHNIYWYGGFDGIDSTENFSDDVWVLSIPSFSWIKVYNGTDTHGRSGHKCSKPYPDQMFVVGGYTSETGNLPTCVTDGIVQVFNLSSAEWLSSYDPSKWNEYSVPEVVLSTIGGTGAGGATKTGPSSWANESMAALFGTNYTKTIKNWYPYPVADTSSPSRTPIPSSHSGGIPKWVAPVLGVVLGLMALSAVVVCILLWRRRKYLKTRASVSGSSTDLSGYRIMSWMRGTQMDNKAPTVTTDDTVPTSPVSEDIQLLGSSHEAAGSQVHEMMGKIIFALCQIHELTKQWHRHFTTSRTPSNGIQ